MASKQTGKAEVISDSDPMIVAAPYNMTNPAVTVNNTITANLTIEAENEMQAGNLTMTLTFYQDGIMQVNMACPGEDPRFSISSTGIGVEWSQLIQVTDLANFTTITADMVTVDGLISQSGLDTFKYEIMATPFRIIQYINNEITLVVNNQDSLRYAPPTAPHDTYMDGNDQLITGYEIGLGFQFSAMNIYGIPQRASNTF